ncbi:DUF1772 domain-containing protein [Paenibacillus psychroresistens]|uniref:DUF1772 domain-containing protein n=1 Tax=Paenibacillus psychroresistens TaxID=1778678 RepID=A0A6B8RE88_9BACL|nr:DUF1772 domain-containing protein [Paenibacillus psychroresistens]QGQ93813.1 DUF1772 domain-containing protein [Paenibacillus psychroresistens]
MIKTIFFSVNLLLVALVVGTMFGIWFGLNPKQMPYPVYLEHQQLLIRSLNVKLPLLAAVGIVLTIISAVLCRKDRNMLLLLIVAAIFLIVAGIITRFLNQPINAKMMTWVIENPPSDWISLRDSWWKWHIVRSIAGLIGLTILILGLLINRSVR